MFVGGLSVGVGSSPHTRGARGRRSTIPRIIEDHPRIRGEHDLVAGVDLLADGSSPHTRGARAGRAGLGPGWRIIPAYAGSTSPPEPRPGPPPDHPRIRGEHAALASQAHSIAGSSPHTRGALGAARAAAGVAGIIPAYAGSTDWISPGRRRCRDHPRIRGEHDHHAAVFKRGERIIPAYAGSTVTVRPGWTPKGDHPRIRGEHTTSKSPRRTGFGSSPHTRGALLPQSP